MKMRDLESEYRIKHGSWRVNVVVKKVRGVGSKDLDKATQISVPNANVCHENKAFRRVCNAHDVYCDEIRKISDGRRTSLVVGSRRLP